MTFSLLLCILVPAPDKPSPALIPGHLEMTWNQQDWLYDFRADGTCETRGQADKWFVDESSGALMTIRFTWQCRWWILTYDNATGKGWGAEVETDADGVEWFRQEVEVKLIPRKVPK